MVQICIVCWNDCLLQRIVNLYEELKRRCQDVTVLGFSFLSQAKFITFVKMYEHEAPAISISVRLKFNFALEIFVHEHLISKDHELFSVVSEKVDSIGKIKHVLNMVNSYYVCSGNHDTNLLGLVPLGKGLSCTPLEAVRAVHEQHISNTYNSTIRSVSCSLLIANNRCNSCKVIRKALLARLNRQSSVKSHQIDFTHYTKPNVFLTSPERWLKLRQFSDRNTELTKKVTRLEEKIEHYSKYCEALICNQGETLNESDNCDILQLAEDCQTTVSDQFPEGSFQRIFFQQQLKYNSLLNKTSMRWHPAIVRWCLYLKHKSAKAYEGVRAFLPLPSERTLFDYSNFLDTGTGFKTSVIQHFSEQAKLQTSTFVGILQDEIKVKSDLVYKKHSGELIGYTNLNMVSNELVDMEKTAASQTANLAEHLLVIMVRGVTSSFKYPLAAFATKSLTADILYSIMWETVEIVEVHAELKVLFFCCDGASQNRKFFNLHINSPGNNLEYKTVNPYDRSRYIYFISDVPHLLKTSRNCFSNSYSHKKSRKLWNNGKDISWMHVVRLYEETCENSEFKLCPKLTRNHIDLSSFSKMKVSLATQVFSATVANALELKYKDEVSGTTKFIRIMNKWFDLMNTKNVLESHKKRNSDLAPFSNASDDRLKWLLGEFLDYFENWEKSVSQYSHGNLSKDDRSKMLLSKQTIHGLRMTTMSVVECIKFLLQQGVPFVLTNHFNQDILEQHFGHYRHKGGHNDNPTVLEACHSLTNIRAVNFHGLAPKRGNITADEGGAAVMDCTPLKKRRP